MYFNYKNVFSRIHHVNVHQALYFDRLHTNEEGLWGDHLWKEVKFWISDLGHEAAVKLDKSMYCSYNTLTLLLTWLLASMDFLDGLI
jgi:hypothetical protein